MLQVDSSICRFDRYFEEVDEGRLTPEFKGFDSWTNFEGFDSVLKLEIGRSWSNFVP